MGGSRGEFKIQAMYVDVLTEGFRTRVRFPPPPPISKEKAPDLKGLFLYNGPWNTVPSRYPGRQATVHGGSYLLDLEFRIIGMAQNLLKFRYGMKRGLGIRITRNLHSKLSFYFFIDKSFPV